jgi:tape measure domain-containing protein
MASLGTAYIKIAPDLTGVQGSISRGLSNAVGNAGNAAGANFGSGFSKFAASPIVELGNKVLKGSLVAASVAAGALVAKNIGGAIKRFDTLNNFPKVMSNLGISADDARSTIKSLSKNLTGLPTTLDTAAMAVQRLTTRTNDVKKSEGIFLAFNNAVLAGGAPMELQSAATEQFAQAFAKGKPDMMEWRSMLSAMPAQLTQVAKAMGQPSVDVLGEKLRDGSISMDDFSQALVGLNSKGVGGLPNLKDQALNATGGVSTGMAVMNTAVQRGTTSIMEAIGGANLNNAIGAIGSAFEGALGGVSRFINLMIEYKDISVPIAIGLGAFATALVGLAIVVKVVAAAQAIWNLAMLSNPLVFWVTVIASAVAALAYFFTQTETGKQIVETAMGAIRSAIDTVAAAFGAIKDKAMEVFNGIKGFIDDHITAIKNIGIVITAFLLPKIAEMGIKFAVSAAKAAAAWVVQLPRIVAQFVITSAAAAKNAVIASASWIKNAVLVGLAWVKNLALMALGFAKTGVQALISAGKVAASWLLAMGPVGLIIAAVVAIAALVIANWDTVKVWLTTFWNWLKETALSAWEGIKAVWSTVSEFFGRIFDLVATVIKTYINIWIFIFTSAWDAIKAVWSAVSGWFSALFSLIWTILKGYVMFYVDSFKLAWEGIKAVWSAVSGWFGSIWSSIKSVFSAVGGFFRGAFQEGIDSIKNVFSVIKGFFSDKLQDIKNVFSPSALIGSGKALIDGLINGIKDGFGKAKEVVKGKLEDIRGLFPFSPAKEGPFSGLGYTTYSGKALMTDFAKGISQTSNLAQNSATSAMSATQSAMNRGFTGTSSIASGFTPATGSQSEYNIGTINISNEVDGERWLRKLTGNQEITSARLTPKQAYM